ncbi:moz represents a chromatin-associated acetyltransferase [Fusarium subglutinans]|uniref:Moz represents a chromatin-associated acetyltransferase n=1 Tax=Gibberella subglutinans TaxID=42677 RepID=A0A8H5V9B7_GIBSU|nr:moz represents a chromatin-associated acetyltransferase [Fusarium subglutinans]KAF5613983.1 moz represents a chromatin-associated acetyltransferase [Fusarium subglutinans]
MTAAARLTFLSPQVLRGLRATPRSAAGFARHRGTFARRRGKAVEPQPLRADTTAKLNASHPLTSETPTRPEPESSTTSVQAMPDKPVSTSEAAASTSSKQQPKENETSKEEQQARTAREEAKQSGPLEAVLHMEPPETTKKTTTTTTTRPGPAMCPPPYVHHFDTYSLVKQLQVGGYTQEQATTSMKAIRTLLAENLEIAQSTLVSKSDVENETYLFTAACSELSTEIKNNRRLEEEQLRQQRTHLQHEVDILTQSLNQEVHTLNDNVRGSFNDRKMAVREEQKSVESSIQQINYKISIVLSSDAKSEIEAVRWILIRRSVLGILFMAVLTLGTLRYATYVSHERQREADRIKKEEEEKRRNGGKQDRATDADAIAILAAN